jgi:hypothetical protein
MADDIRIEITGDSSDIKKVLKVSEKLVKRFEKANKKATDRRVRNEKKASSDIQMAEARKNKRLESMDRRLSRKRARIRLRRMKENIRIAKREATAEERIKKRSIARMKKFAKFGVAALGIGGIAGVVMASKALLDFDLALTRLAAGQDISIKKQAAMRAEIMKMTIATGVSRESLLETMDAIIQKSGDIPLATENLEELSKVLRVKGEEFAGPIGQLLAAMSKPLAGTGIKPIKVLEQIIAQGKEGSIVMEEMAIKGQEIFGSMASLGAENFAGAMALLQMMGRVVGSEKAITSFSLFFNDLERAAPKLKKDLKWDIYESPGKLKSPIKLATELMEKTQGIKANLIAVPGVTVNIIRMFDALLTDLKANNGELKDTNRFLDRAKNASGIIAGQYARIEKTGANAFAKIKALGIELIEGAIGDSLQSVVDALNDFLADPKKLQQLKETFADIGVVANTLVKALTLLSGRQVTKNIETAERYKFLQKNLSFKERVKLTMTPRKEMAAVVDKLYFEMNTKLLFDPITGNILGKSTNVKDLNNKKVGKTFISTNYTSRLNAMSEREEYVTP